MPKINEKILQETGKTSKKPLQAAFSQNQKLLSQLQQPPIPNIDENQLTKNMDEEVVEQQLVEIGGFFVSGKAMKARNFFCDVSGCHAY